MLVFKSYGKPTNEKKNKIMQNHNEIFTSQEKI